MGAPLSNRHTRTQHARSFTTTTTITHPESTTAATRTWEGNKEEEGKETHNDDNGRNKRCYCERKKNLKKGIAIGKTRQPKKNRKKETGGSTRCGPRCHTRGAIPLIELLEAKSLRALTEAATADVQVVLVDETVTVRTHTAAGRTLALVVGMAVIESSVTHVYKGSSKKC